MTTNDFGLVANHKDYLEIYNAFCGSCREEQKVWVEKDLVPKIRDVYMKDNDTPMPEFKVLAVGSNEGAFDRLFIKALFSYAKELMEEKHVIYTVVEPNTVALDEFKRNISSQDAVLRNVKFNWVNKPVEEFLETEEPEQYDLIQFVHCLYYVKNEEEILKRAYEKFLASPGCILTAVATEGNIWVNLIESFKTKIPSLALNQPTNIKLSEICKRNGWEIEIFDAKLDLEVTEIFNERDPVGQAKLKFFLNTNEEPKEKLGKELMTEVTEFLGRFSWEKIKDGKKCLVVKDDEGILLTYKRS